MKRKTMGVIILMVIMGIGACASVPRDRYNTQKGALIGAGAGALMGQAIGRDTEGTLMGLAAGTVLGALVGNAMDQDYAAARDAALYEKKVVYYDNQGGAVEAIPSEVNQQTNCHKVTKRTWKDGKLIRETIEEVCEGEKQSGEY
ncbi:MAG: YMGG-like glycine zipper-containing protein [Desulfobacteraceae bacterium]|jgi:hypothetical protein